MYVQDRFTTITTNHLPGTPVTIEQRQEAAYDAVLQRLLSGDIAGYTSQSNADFVLIMKLLHWTGDNVEPTRSIFLDSPLGQREKAKRKTGQTTYDDMTITNALKKRRNPPMKR